MTTFVEQQQRASVVYRRALATGELIRSDICERCGRKSPDRNLDGHHHRGYDDEHALDVQWLCRSCHRSVHLISDELRGIQRPTTRIMIHPKLSPALLRRLDEYCRHEDRDRTSAIRRLLDEALTTYESQHSGAATD